MCVKVGVQECSSGSWVKHLRSCAWGPWCVLTAYGLESKVNKFSSLGFIFCEDRATSTYCYIPMYGIQWVLSNHLLKEWPNEVQRVGNKSSFHQSQYDKPRGCDSMIVIKNGVGHIRDTPPNTHRDRASDINKWAGCDNTESWDQWWNGRPTFSVYLNYSQW